MQVKQLPPWVLLPSFCLHCLGRNLDATLGHRLRSLKEFRFILSFDVKISTNPQNLNS
jgi:hypothetical protein